MRLIKKYWEWNEKFNKTPFKLGSCINELEKGKLVVKKCDNEYTSSNESIKLINTYEGNINAVFFKDGGDLFCKKNISELEIKDFIKEVDKILIPAGENVKGDILFVVFRGGFASLFGIIRK